MRRIPAVVCVCLAALAAGCIQDQKVLKLQRDGSGTLTEEVYMSPQITGMMEQMAASMTQGLPPGGRTTDTAQAAAKVDPMDLFKADIEKRTAELGPDVRLVSKVSKANAQGWKGYAVTYQFKDINKVHLSLSDPKQDETSEPDKAKGEPLQVTFRKTPHPTLVIKQKAPLAAAGAQPQAADPAGGSETNNAMPAAMMSAMLQGMRITFSVEVDGKILKTTGRYRQGDNRVVLLDLPMDKVLAHAAGAKLLGGNQDDPAMLEKIRALKIEGLAIEDLSRGIEIEWQ